MSTPHHSNDNISTFSRESRFKEHLAEAEADVEPEPAAHASGSAAGPALRPSSTERLRRKLQNLRRKPVPPHGDPALDTELDEHGQPKKTRTKPPARLASSSSSSSIRSAASSASKRVGASMRSTATAVSRKMHASAEVTAAALRSIPGAHLVTRAFGAIADKLPAGDGLAKALSAIANKLPGGDRLAKAFGAVAERIPRIPRLPSWDKAREWTRGAGTGFLAGLSPRRWTSPFKFAWR